MVKKKRLLVAMVVMVILVILKGAVEVVIKTVLAVAMVVSAARRVSFVCPETLLKSVVVGSGERKGICEPQENNGTQEPGREKWRKKKRIILLQPNPGRTGERIRVGYLDSLGSHRF